MKFIKTICYHAEKVEYISCQLKAIRVIEGQLYFLNLFDLLLRQINWLAQLPKFSCYRLLYRLEGIDFEHNTVK